MGCWISDAYQLHGLCRGDVKNSIKSYDSGRKPRPGEESFGGGGGESMRGEKKNAHQPDIPTDQALVLLLSNHVYWVK